MQDHAVVTNNPQISGAGDNFLAHTMSTAVRLEALQCVSLILRTRRTEQPRSGTLLVIVAGGKRALKGLLLAINVPEWK